MRPKPPCWPTSDATISTRRTSSASRRCSWRPHALKEIEATIDALTGDAIVAIKVADITDEARDALVDLAHFVAWRES